MITFFSKTMFVSIDSLFTDRDRSRNSNCCIFQGLPIFHLQVPSSRVLWRDSYFVILSQLEQLRINVTRVISTGNIDTLLLQNSVVGKSLDSLLYVACDQHFDAFSIPIILGYLTYIDVLIIKPQAANIWWQSLSQSPEPLIGTHLVSTHYIATLK
jgi:hypothetical protein